MDPATTTTTEPVVRLIPLGGLGEIGLNMMLLESGDDLVAVDCGLMFPDDELLGIDYVIPDFTYVLAKGEGFRAVLLTHGHEDHIGAIPYLLRAVNVPVYGTPMTLALVAEKLREHGLLEGADLRPMRPRSTFEVGSFRVEPIRVTHSIVDGIGLAIDTPVGTVVLTGDFKLDPSPLDGEPSDYRRFAELGEQGVALLCSDSTNVDRAGHTRSEVDVGAALAERFARAPGRIILATFASHIHRIQHVLTLAERFGRRVALLGRSMEKNVTIAAELGYLRMPPGLVQPLEDVVELPPHQQVILSTGSQGEPHSALSLMAAGEHKYVADRPGRPGHHLGPRHSRPRAHRGPRDQRPLSPRRRGPVRGQRLRPRLRARQPGGSQADAEPHPAAVLRAGARRVPPPPGPRAPGRERGHRARADLPDRGRRRRGDRQERRARARRRSRPAASWSMARGSATSAPSCCAIARSCPRTA